MPSRMRNSLGLGLLVLALLLPGTVWAGKPTVTRYRMRVPGPAKHHVEQASDLCYGQLAGRDGLWMACDRNGGLTGGRIYRFAPATLASAFPDGTLVADEEIIITAPIEGWASFCRDQKDLGVKVLGHIHERVAVGGRLADGKPLDLEAITIGLSPTPPHEARLFVVAEEPHSLVLELRLGKQGQPTKAELVAAYRYYEPDDQHGADFNDGLEGLAYAGVPGQFWWVEEGTCLHAKDAHPRLFFGSPRLGLCELKDRKVVPIEPISQTLTLAVKRQKLGNAQTLNALCATRDGGLLAVDRNGGWVLRVDPRDQTVSRWLNIYDIAGVNLRQFLVDFPARRVMPYVSIEGVAVDNTSNLWLVDDPAMPEAFRDSCLIRVANLSLPGSSAASMPATSRPPSD